jgi:hypothetical protein
METAVLQLWSRGQRLALPYHPYEFDNFLARLGRIGMLALETCERCEGLQKLNPFLLIFVCAFDTKFPSVSFG